MRVEIPEIKLEDELSAKLLPTPDFIYKMDDFIQIAHDLKKKIPELLGDYSQLGIVGIGGSQVQPIIFHPHAKVHITHLEVPDPYILKHFLNNDLSTTRILYLSRSGTTKEVLSFIPFLKKYPSLVVTNGGNLLKIAKILNFPVIPVSYDISGRFAIQNELGIVPMVAMGLDPVKFLISLKESYESYFITNSLAEQVAKLILMLERGKKAKMRILTSGFYPQGLGILFTQLINESAPKDLNDEIDSSLHFMPRGAHSDLQRWYGGKHDSFVFSILCENYQTDYTPGGASDLEDLVPSTNLNAGKHLNITSKAVEDTFPGEVIRVVLESDTLEELAICVGFLHAVTVKLCQLKGSDPFNQPAVQKYKDRATDIYNKLRTFT